MINKNKLTTTIESLAQEDCVQISELPGIDLYMDQVLKFLNTHIKPTDPNTELAFTKNMINNYARKDSILMQPKERKYNQYHILSLILIHNLKNILSMEDIKVLFAAMFKDIDNAQDDIIQPEQAYAAFCKLQQSCLSNMSDELEKKLKLIAPTASSTNHKNDELLENILLVLTLVTEANIYKKLAEKIICDKFNKEDSI